MKKSILLGLLVTLLGVTNLHAEVIYLTTADFKSKIMDYSTEKEWKYKGKKPCVIDFYATWCGPCKKLAPIMDELSNKYKGKVTFYKSDTEKERELSYVFQISSIPQVLYIPVTGQPILLKGLYPKEEIAKIIDEHLLGKKVKGEK